MRRAARIDDNQSAIVKALRSAGVTVEVIKKPVDLLIHYRGATAVMEVKNPDGRDQLTADQVQFIARWPGPVHVVRSVREALEAVLGKEVLA